MDFESNRYGKNLGGKGTSLRDPEVAIRTAYLASESRVGRAGGAGTFRVGLSPIPDRSPIAKPAAIAMLATVIGSSVTQRLRVLERRRSSPSPLVKSSLCAQVPPNS
jgi:hypothetical protein